MFEHRSVRFLITERCEFSFRGFNINYCLCTCLESPKSLNACLSLTNLPFWLSTWWKTQTFNGRLCRKEIHKIPKMKQKYILIFVGIIYAHNTNYFKMWQPYFFAIHSVTFFVSLPTGLMCKYFVKNIKNYLQNM